MTDQVSTFAVTDASTSSLKKMWQQMATDKQVFWPRLKGTNHNTIQFLRRITPQTAPQFGNTTIYQMDDAGDFVEDLTLELQLSALTLAPGGTFAAYRNDISGIIQSIRFYQAGTLLQELRFDNQVFQDAYFTNFEEKQALLESAGILPFATRSARSVAVQNFYIPLRTFLDYFSAPLSLLTSAIRIEITFKQFQNTVQFDVAPPTGSILAANLRVRYTNANPQMMSEMLEISKGSGMLFPFTDVAFTQNDFAPGTANIRFLLSEFRSLTLYLGAWLRESQQLDDQTGNPAFEWTNTVGFTNWNMQDRGVNIISNPDDLNPDYTKLHEIPEKFHCYFDPAQRFINFPMIFSWDIEPTVDLHLSETESYGYYDFSKTNSAYLNVNFPASANALRLTAYGFFLNVLILRNGSLTKYTL